MPMIFGAMLPSVLFSVPASVWDSAIAFPESLEYSQEHARRSA